MIDLLTIVKVVVIVMSNTRLDWIFHKSKQLDKIQNLLPSIWMLEFYALNSTLMSISFLVILLGEVYPNSEADIHKSKGLDPRPKGHQSKVFSGWPSFSIRKM